jgi:hypothetical protein
VSGQDDHRLLADLGKKIMEADALGRIEAGGRLVDDYEARVAQQCLPE